MLNQEKLVKKAAMKDNLEGNSDKEEQSLQRKSADKEQLDNMIKQCITSLEEKIQKTFQQEIEGLRTDCSELREKKAGLESAMEELKQECLELREKNTRLEGELLQKANQQQLEKIKEEMQTKMQHEAQTLRNDIEQAKEGFQKKLNNTIENAVNEVKNELRPPIRKEASSIKQKIHSANHLIGKLFGTQQKEFGEEKHKTDDEPVGTQICIPENKWGKWDTDLDVSGFSVTCKPQEYSGTVRAKQPFLFAMESSKRRIAYFEVKIVSMSTFSGIKIGLCSSNFPFCNFLYLSSKEIVGNYANSFAIDFQGYIRNGEKEIRRESGFYAGDTVGCGLDMPPDTVQCRGCGLEMPFGPVQCRLFFTRNGALNGTPIQLTVSVHGVEFFPAVTIRHDEKIEAIFDQNAFKYDLHKHLVEH